MYGRGSTILSNASLLDGSTNMTFLARLDNVKMLQLTTNKRGMLTHSLSDWDQILDILRNGKRKEIQRETTSLCIFHMSRGVSYEYMLTLFVGKDQLRCPLFPNSQIFHIINGAQNDLIIQLDVENFWLVWHDTITDSDRQFQDITSVLARVVDYKVYGDNDASRINAMHSSTTEKTLPRLPKKVKAVSDTIPSMSMLDKSASHPLIAFGHFTEHLSQSAGGATLLKLESDQAPSHDDGSGHTQMSTVREEQEEIEAAIASLLRSRAEVLTPNINHSTTIQQDVDSDESDIEPVTPAAAVESAAALDYLEVRSRKLTLEDEPERTEDGEDSSVLVLQNLPAISVDKANCDAERRQEPQGTVQRQSIKESKNPSNPHIDMVLYSAKSKLATLLQVDRYDTQRTGSQYEVQVLPMDHICSTDEMKAADVQDHEEADNMKEIALDVQQSGNEVENIVSTEDINKTATSADIEIDEERISATYQVSEEPTSEFLLQQLSRRSASAASSSPRSSSYRNSIVIVDDETGDVVGVVQEDLVLDGSAHDPSKVDEDVQQSLAAIDATLNGSLCSQEMSLTSTVVDHNTDEQPISGDALIADKASPRQRSASQHSVEPSTATTVYHDAEDSAEWFEEQAGTGQVATTRPETSFFPLEGDDDASAVEVDVDVDDDGHLTITSTRNVSSEAIVARPYHLPLLGYVTTIANWFSNIIGLSWVLGWNKESKDALRIHGIHDHQKLHRQRMNDRKLSLRYHDDSGHPHKVYLASRGTAFLEARSAFI